MPFYKNIDASSEEGRRIIDGSGAGGPAPGVRRRRSGAEGPDSSSEEGRRIIEGIQRLRTVELPEKTLDKTLLLASWNLRELGGRRKSGRDGEALFYIAEIISRFDLVAVQEVRDNLDELERLVTLLGQWWPAPCALV